MNATRGIVLARGASGLGVCSLPAAAATLPMTRAASSSPGSQAPPAMMSFSRLEGHVNRKSGYRAD